MNILNFGSLNIDKTYSVPHIVREGETVSSIFHQEFVGGKGLNQSIAIARAGGRVWHAGLIGQEDGEALIQVLEESGVNTELVEKCPLPSGHTIIQIDKSGNNSIIVSGGANQAVDSPFIDKVLSNFNAGDLLLLQNEISSFEEILCKASEKGLSIYLNPSPINDTILKAPLDKVDCFLINEIEGKCLTGKEDPESIMEKMKAEYPGAALILTLGSKGAYYQKGEEQIFCPAFKVKAVDTTGAGDTFCGYFLANFTGGLSIEDSMKKASRAAAIACTIKGAANSIPKKEDLV